MILEMNQAPALTEQILVEVLQQLQQVCAGALYQAVHGDLLQPHQHGTTAGHFSIPDQKLTAACFKLSYAAAGS